MYRLNSENPGWQKLLAWAGLYFLLVISLQRVLAAEEPASGGEQATQKPQVEQRLPGFDVERFSAGTSQSSSQWLASASDPRQVIWLNGSSDAPQSFLGLYLPNNSARNEGGLVILPDAAQHPDWPRLVGVLRHGLADSGWHTLAIQLQGESLPVPAGRVMAARGAADFPYPGAVARPDRGGAVTSGALNDAAAAAPHDTPSGAALSQAVPAVDPRVATNAETEKLEQQNAEQEQADLNMAATGSETVDAAPEKAGLENAQRLEMALERLTQFGLQHQAIVGVGDGAAVVLGYLQTKAAVPDRGFAVVLVNARLGESTLLQLKERQSMFQKLRILDLYDSQNPVAVTLARERHHFAGRNRMQGYEQAGLPMLGRHSSVVDEALLARLSGWLKRSVPGQEPPFQVF
jgi:hypothetical protein